MDRENEILTILPVRIGQDFIDSYAILGISNEEANQTLKILMDKKQVDVLNDTFVLTESGRKRVDELKAKMNESKLEMDALSKKTIKEALWENKKNVIHPAQSFFNDLAYTCATVPFKSEKSNVNISCIITSDRNCIKLKDVADSNIQLEEKPIPTNPENYWSLPYLQLFLENKNEPADLKDVFELVKSKYQFYIDIPDQKQYSLLSLWVVGTYFHQLFDTYPYLFINATKRAGKTKLLNLTYCISFNGDGFVAPSSSSIFRLIRSTLCTLCIDEIEKINKKEESDIRAMLLAGYKRGVTIPRIEEISQGNAKIRVVNRFEVYSPKMMANISGMEGTLEDRAITIILLRTDNKEIGNRAVEVKRNNPEWQMIRNKLYLNMMLNWKIIQSSNKLFDDLYRSIVKDDELEESLIKLRENISSRHLELWKPLFVIALSISKDVFKEVVDLALDMVKEKEELDVSESFDVSLLSALIPLVRSTGWYKTSELTREMKNYEDLDWVTSNVVGKALGRMKIREGLRKKEGKKEVFIRVDSLKKLAKKFHLDYDGLFEEENEEVVTSREEKFQRIVNSLSRQYPDGFKIDILVAELEKEGIEKIKGERMIERAKSDGLLFEPSQNILKKVIGDLSTYTRTEISI